MSNKCLKTIDTNKCIRYNLSVIEGRCYYGKVLKKGFSLLGIYIIFLIIVFLMSDRIMRLDKQDVYRNTNGSVTIIK